MLVDKFYSFSVKTEQHYQMIAYSYCIVADPDLNRWPNLDKQPCFIRDPDLLPVYMYNMQ
jgi:hypothetical protein